MLPSISSFFFCNFPCSQLEPIGPHKVILDLSTFGKTATHFSCKPSACCSRLCHGEKVKKWRSSRHRTDRIPKFPIYKKTHNKHKLNQHKAAVRRAVGRSGEGGDWLLQAGIAEGVRVPSAAWGGGCSVTMATTQSKLNKARFQPAA